MLRIIMLLMLVSISVTGYAQETLWETNSYAPNVTENYQVLKSNTNIKHGIYRAFYKKKIAIAIGKYTQGKKTGVWHFYDEKGYPVQNYNYDDKQLVFLAKIDTNSNTIQYEFVPKPIATDSVTLPIRIGGLFYGYLPYIRKFKVQNAYTYQGSIYGALQILISPNGQLADCKLLVRNRTGVPQNYAIKDIDSYVLSNDLLNTDDKEFVPAKINHQNISSMIYLYCKIEPNGNISIF